MPSLTTQNRGLTDRGAAQGQLSDRDVCLIHLDGRMYSPWVHRDDSVEVNFAVETPYKDGLYAVSVGGGITVCNLRGGVWCFEEARPSRSSRIEKMRRSELSGYEIIGSVLNIVSCLDRPNDAASVSRREMS